MCSGVVGSENSSPLPLGLLRKTDSKQDSVHKCVYVTMFVFSKTSNRAGCYKVRVSDV